MRNNLIFCMLAAIIIMSCAVFSSPLVYYVNPLNTTSAGFGVLVNVTNYNTYVTQNISQYCITNVTINNQINVSNIDGNYIKAQGFNYTYELKSYFDTLYYSILNPVNFINSTVSTILNFYNKTDIDNMLLSYLTRSDYLLYNTTIWSGINSKLNITDQRYNDTGYINSVRDNLSSSINSNFSNLSSSLSNAITANFTVNNNSISSLRTAFLANDTYNYNLLNSSLAGKGNLIGENVWIGNNYFVGNITIYNSTMTEYNTSIIVSVGSTVYFNVTYGNVYIGNYLKVNGDINATNINANINSNYVLNPPWLNATDQRYNDSGAINAVNRTSNIQSLGFLNSSADWLNDSLSWYSILNPAGHINLSNITTSLIQNLGFLNSSADILQDSNLTRTYMTNGSIINASQINATSININSGNLTITSRYKICYDDGACKVFSCYNGTHLLMSNNRTGITC